MANTFELIASSTVGSGGAASISFSSIPSTYTDLVIKISGRSDLSQIRESFKINLNGSTASFTEKGLYGLGTGGSGSESNANPLFASAATATSNTFSSIDIYVPNYTSSNYKSISMDSVTESNDASGPVCYLASGLWSNTSSVSSITFTFSSASNFVQYSTAYLYGVKNA
jgi:hypothetical protein